MNTLRVWLALFVVLGLVLLPACGGGGDDDDDGGGDDSGEESDDPTRAPRPTRTPTPAPEFVPVFAPGAWTGGEATVTVSGGASTTVTGTLLARSSSSEKDTTRLTFTNDLDTINISISKQYQPFAMTVYKAPVYGQSEESCQVTYTSTDEKRIEGSFKCTGTDIEQGGNGQPGVFEGTFFATR